MSYVIGSHGNWPPISKKEIREQISICIYASYMHRYPCFLPAEYIIMAPVESVCIYL